LRVLHILNELRFSGAERMLLAAAGRFAQQGIESTILSVGAEPGPMAARLAAAGYRLEQLPFAASAAFLARLRRHVAGRFDVVHLHAERGYFWLALAVRAAGVRAIVRTIHAGFAFTGALRLERRIQRALLRRAGVKQVAISPSVQEIEQDRFGNPTLLIPNWYDDRHFRPPTPAERAAARAALGLADGQTAVACVGNCEAVKDHPTLLRALAIAPGRDRLVLLHAGAEQAGAPERRLCEELGIAHQVRFLGAVDDVRPVLHAADLFVMCSLREGFGLAAIEALACGVPAVLTDVPGLRDLRGRFRYAEAPAGDPAALAARLGAGRPESDNPNPAAARRYYGVNAGVEAYVALYHAAAGQP
jgi:glycosyltransferase involved in cell wall biosynthesis